MSQLRSASVSRNSSETQISAKVVIDGSGKVDINTGIGFFDHMLNLFAKHGSFNITIECKGDLEIDGHHTVEDCGIVLGKAFSQAIGDKKGINRYGSFFAPMDEALAFVAIDVSGRPHLEFESPELQLIVGDFDSELFEEFLKAFIIHCAITLHLKVLYGKNTHHMIEAGFKALARALKQALAIEGNGNEIPSTKGIID